MKARMVLTFTIILALPVIFGGATGAKGREPQSGMDTLASPALWAQENFTSPNLIRGYSGNSVITGVVGATVAGGRSDGSPNTVTDDYGTVGGGRNNRAGDNAGTTTDASYATVGGGSHNSANSSHATISGGSFNTASGRLGTIGGGMGNAARGYASIGGGWRNIAGEYAAVAGGWGNIADEFVATISGGSYNTVLATHSTIGGGQGNDISRGYATIGGGYFNNASGLYATVAGGRINTANGEAASVAGGHINIASGDAASVAGGYNNTASGYIASVGGGRDNEAVGDYSFATGRRAKANHQGAFVWADAEDADFASTAQDQFSARTTGGARFVSAIDGSGNPTGGVNLAAGSGAWSSLSDHALKQNFAPVDAEEVLARLAEVPITTWNYQAQDPTIRHMGPVAQDFYSAFGLGEDDRHISTVDADGVALAAIQGLYQMLQEKDAQLAAQQEQIAALEARLAELEALVAKLAQEQ